MKNHKICMKLITLLLCFAMTFAAPLTVLAGEEVERPSAPEQEPSYDYEVYVLEIETPEPAPVADLAPEVTEQVPEVTESVPEVTESVPEVTEPEPEVTEPVPEVTEPAPEITEPVPEVTEPAPEVTEPLPVAEPDTPAETPEVSLFAAPAISGSVTPATDDSAVPAEEETVLPAEDDILPEEEYEDSTEGAGKEKKISDDYTDAEKYYETDYDKSLCWAATAANMLWDGNYAQKAINPLTNEYFRSEDEVFDYFRKCFVDKGASPDMAIEYFVDGTTTIALKKNYKEFLRNDAPAGGLLKGVLSDDDMKMVYYQKTDPMIVLNDLDGVTAGALLRWWIADEGQFTRNAHWLTVVSVDKDEQGKYTGIWLADSDNDVATRAGKIGHTPEEKAKLASEMPNSYTHYDLSYETVGSRDLWVVVDYGKRKTVIWYICTLAENDYDDDPEEPEDWDDWEEGDEPNDTMDFDDWDEWEEIDDDDDDADRWIPEDIEKRIRDLIEKERSEEDGSDDDYDNGIADDNTGYVEVIVLDYDMINEGMIENNIEYFSLSNGVFNKLTDTTYKMIIRRDPATLKSVSVDGNSISDYSVRDISNGSFEINIGSSLLRSLEPGTHTLKMEFAGGKDIVTTFEVK